MDNLYIDWNKLIQMDLVLSLLKSEEKIPYKRSETIEIGLARINRTDYGEITDIFITMPIAEIIKIDGIDYIQINSAGRSHKGFVEEAKQFLDDNNAPLKIAKNTYRITIITVAILITQIFFEYTQCVKETRREYREVLQQKLQTQQYIDTRVQFLLQQNSKPDTTDSR